MVLLQDLLSRLKLARAHALNSVTRANVDSPSAISRVRCHVRSALATEKR